MQKYSDAELVALYIKSKGPEYLTELFKRHGDIVYRTALRIMKNPSDAEDILQTVYCKMITNLHLYKGTGSVIGWMLQVVIHTCYNQLQSEKSRYNREKKIMSERVQTTSPKNHELKEMIENHLNKLPEIYKAPITLQIMEGLSIKEVSEALEIPEKTIRSQIARGLEKLKVSLQSVGVTASVIAIGDVLKQIQQPVAPEAIMSNQYFLSLIQNKASASTKLAITTTTKSALLSKMIVSGLFLAVSFGGLIVWNHYSKIAPTPVPKTLVSQKWDFENTNDLDQYQSIGLLRGAISIVNERGINQSKALVVEENSLIEFDISKYQLPIKISYSSDTMRPTNGPDFVQAFLKGNFQKNKNIRHIFELRDRISVVIPNDNPNSKLGYFGNWFSHVAYIDEDSVDFFVNGKRSHLLMSSSIDNKKIYLNIGQAIIDDLTIESIDKKLLPVKPDLNGIKTNKVNEFGMTKYYFDKSQLGLDVNSKNNPFQIEKDPKLLAEEVGLNLPAYFAKVNPVNKNIEWRVESSLMTQKWDFESTDDLNQYKGMCLSKGSISLVESGDSKKSNVLLAEEDSTIELDISKFQLPIKISYIADYIVDKKLPDNSLHLMIKGNYMQNQSVLFFTELREFIHFPRIEEGEIGKSRGKWLKYEGFIDENDIDIWFEGKRSQFLRERSNDNKKLFLYFKGKTLIDNLKIESIHKKDVPNKDDIEKIISGSDGLEKGKKQFIAKEKLGLTNSDSKPYFIISDPDPYLKPIGIQNEAIHPSLSALKKVEWRNNKTENSRKWNFENDLDRESFVVIRGKSSVIKNAGINNSDCLEVQAGTVHEIDISTFKLPLKITYSFDCILPPGVTGKGIVMAKSNYEPDKNIFNLTNLQVTKSVDVSEGSRKNKNPNAQKGYIGMWNTRTIYVSDEAVDLWFNGKRSGLLIGKSLDNKKLYLCDLDQSIMDDFSISSIEPGSVPDFSIFKKFTDSIPFEKGGRGYPMENEKSKLNIEKECQTLLGIYDKYAIENALGLDKK